MSQAKQGTLLWEGKRITWMYSSFKSNSMEIHPHFVLIATDPATSESVTWDDIKVEMLDKKTITDFTKLPVPVRNQILDNVIEPLLASSLRSK